MLSIGRPDNRPEHITAHSRKAYSLLMDVLESYGPALRVGAEYELVRDVRPIFELLRRYRIYTRYLGSVAQEIWPDVNLEPLLKLV